MHVHMCVCKCMLVLYNACFVVEPLVFSSDLEGNILMPKIQINVSCAVLLIGVLCTQLLANS